MEKVIYIFLAICLHFLYGTWGIKEAVLWSRKGVNAFEWNEHAIFNVERILLFICLFLAVGTSYYLLAVLAIASLFTYSFVHNLYYYYFRSVIDGKPFDPFYTSTTSTSRFTLNITVRSILFVIGLIILYFGFQCRWLLTKGNFICF